ncbi:MAG: hypothetical protein V2I40_14605 [Desulfobacteraceae bacterium]|nr:hypothetical protein [Desulfobacteraceae bacterium]
MKTSPDLISVVISTVRKIVQDGDRFIRETPDLALSSLPRSRQAKQVRGLLDVLVARTTQLLSEQEGLVSEQPHSGRWAKGLPCAFQQGEPPVCAHRRSPQHAAST